MSTYLTRPQRQSCATEDHWKIAMCFFLVLALASPAFAAVSLSTTNDLFKALAERRVKPPEPPVCCLRPLPSSEPIQDEMLLSFEEWKEKQTVKQAEQQQGKKTQDKDANGNEWTSERGDNPSAAPAEVFTHSAPLDAPHFRVPITDRFNYASMDCSARVHTSHRSAKSPASILSSKRDKYMLSPCKDQKQYIVVELCEDIRIDTVQLANFEFFSGVFKKFTVSVSKTYTTDPEGWTVASTHTAKNIRVVQSFHPPTSLRDFYRYIRIDFHSHYGNEFYCPISLLRVYGLTHLEEYKWEIWEDESRAKRGEIAAPTVPLEVNEPEPAVAPEPVRIPPSYAEFMDAAATELESTKHPETSVETSSEIAQHLTLHGHCGGNADDVCQPEPTSVSTTAPSGGESIYRTIMNRLTALEANHTLYARYVEEHTSAVREMLRRVGEDLGRAEGVGKAQAQLLARSLRDWERQQMSTHIEYLELLRKVQYLSDEIVLEKRLGVAQLLLLLAVLIFMSLTRGSRGEPVIAPSSSIRSWGRRHLSLGRLGSGEWDWVGKLKSRSHSPPELPTSKQDSPAKVVFPSRSEDQADVSKHRPPRLNLSLTRSRTGASETAP
ncbi:unnamed protein product [Mycena citricolor]|uniref:SUN domain-containing protein n=1 Tax=Mycena citricolor TaxID=2018698 RepID=A0AAD2JVJ0_9AGAR|nr:unnamed protein product [Mycena citricolor]